MFVCYVSLVFLMYVLCVDGVMAGSGWLLQRRPAFVTNNELRIAVDLWCTGEPGRTDTETTYGPIGDWDVSRITDMSHLFRNKNACNPDIGKWNTAAVTDMS